METLSINVLKSKGSINFSFLSIYSNINSTSSDLFIAFSSIVSFEGVFFVLGGGWPKLSVRNIDSLF